MSTLRERCRALVENGRFQSFIIGLIIVNAGILGLETSDTVMAGYGTLLHRIDHVILGVFVAELLARIYAHRLRFFTDPWSLFDTAVVGIALVPNTGAFAVLRALRVLRVLRLISVVPAMRSVVQALLKSLPGLGAIVALLGLVFYVAAVMATQLFGDAFPDWFGTLGASFYSLFQIMTLESWSMGIVRPVMEVYPLAWIFFVSFILIGTFTMLNLFIAVVVNAMQSQHVAEQGVSDREALAQAHSERDLMLAELKAIRVEIAALRTERSPAPRPETESA